MDNPTLSDDGSHTTHDSYRAASAHRKLFRPMRKYELILVTVPFTPLALWTDSRITSYAPFVDNEDMNRRKWRLHLWGISGWQIGNWKFEMLDNGAAFSKVLRGKSCFHGLQSISSKWTPISNGIFALLKGKYMFAIIICHSWRSLRHHRKQSI